MYCEDSFGTDVEHFRPKSSYPATAFTWLNYLLACAHCNSNLKRTEFPLDEAGGPQLIDPSLDDPERHLVLTLRSGKYVALDARGAETIRVFRLDRGILERGRRGRWTSLKVLVPEYARMRRVGDEEAAALLAAAIQDESFGAVLQAMVRAADSADGEYVLGSRCAAAIRERSEIRTWR